MIAFAAAGVITGAIFLIWLISFLASIERQGEFVEQSPDASTNFSSFFESFEEATNLIQRETDVVREQFQSITSPVESEEDPVFPEDIPGIEETTKTNDINEEDTPTSEGVEITPSGLELIRVEDSASQDSQPQ